MRRPVNRSIYIDGTDTTPKLFRSRARPTAKRTAHREKHSAYGGRNYDDYFTRRETSRLGLVSLGLETLSWLSILFRGQ